MACLENRKQKTLKKHKGITTHVEGSVDYRPCTTAPGHMAMQYFEAVLSSVSTSMKKANG